MKGNADKPVKAGPVQVQKQYSGPFFGVRKHTDHVADVESLTLKQVVIGGIIGTALFVGTLLLLVKLITN